MMCNDIGLIPTVESVLDEEDQLWCVRSFRRGSESFQTMEESESLQCRQQNMGELSDTISENGSLETRCRESVQTLKQRAFRRGRQ